MKNITLQILTALLFFPLVILGQEKELECVEYESIEMYNLRKAIIKKQNLNVWPSIVQIKELTELNNKRNDSLILFLAETDNGDRLRMTNTTDLSKFAEIDYTGNCEQDGTILTDLKFGEINLSEMRAEIFCKKEKYAELKIKN